MKLKPSICCVLGLSSLFGCAQTNYVADGQITQITVNAEQVKSEQNPLFYGGNNIYPNGAQGLMNKKTGEFDKRTLELSQLLGFRTYRFPGGSEANLYKWKRGIGPMNKRIQNVSGNYQYQRDNHFGSDEFGRLLETTTFDHGMIMVAWGYEKPNDAADWVEYMNSPVGANPNGGIDWAKIRAENGHPEPYNIKIWEIGNEVSGNWELNWGSYPYKGDAKRGTGNVQFDEATGKAGTLPFGSADRYIFGGYKYFQQQKAVKQTTWAEKRIKTTGKPKQTYYVKFAPVSLEKENKPFKLVISGETWQRVDSFKNSKPNSKHYVLEPEEGKVTFGNGKQGKIPAKGQFVYVDYLSGKQPGFIEYYEKMKAVDPSITILSCFEKESFYKIMAKAKKPFDGVIQHYYPWFWMKLPKDSKPDLAYKHSIKAGLNIAKAISHHPKRMKKYPNPALTGNEKIWYTEYGPRTHVDQMALMQTVINDYHDIVGSLTVHSLFLDNNTPLIDNKGKIRSAAYPITVFSQHSEQFFVQTKTDAPIAYTYKKTKVPALLSTASVDANKQRLSLILTNTSPDAAVKAKVNLNGFKADSSKKVELWKLASTIKDKVLDLRNNQTRDAAALTKVGEISLEDALNISVEKGAVYILHFKS